MKAAAIDIGTNSVQIAIGEKTAEGRIILLDDATTNPRLGEGFEPDRSLKPEAIDRALSAAEGFIKSARDMGVGAFRIAGTSAIRDASNQADFLEEASRRLGEKIIVLSEADEAKLSYLSIALDPEIGGWEDEQAVVDVGGGSTEITFGKGKEIIMSSSVPIGAVRLTERFLKGNPPDVCQLVDAGAGAERLLRRIINNLNAQRVVGVGGSIVNIARIWAEVPVERTMEIHNLKMSFRDLRKVIDVLSRLTSEERRKLIGLEPERADIILAGAVIIDRVLAMFESEEIIVSARGLRHGILYELLNELP